MIIAGTNKGPMMQATEIVEAKVYLVQQHAVVSYSMIDEDIGSLAYDPIKEGSFIKRRRTWETDNGGGECVEHLLCSDIKEIQLLESYSDKNIKADGRLCVNCPALPTYRFDET